MLPSAWMRRPMKKSFSNMRRAAPITATHFLPTRRIVPNPKIALKGIGLDELTYRKIATGPAQPGETMTARGLDRYHSSGPRSIRNPEKSIYAAK